MVPLEDFHRLAGEQLVKRIAIGRADVVERNRDQRVLLTFGKRDRVIADSMCCLTTPKQKGIVKNHDAE